MDIIVYWFLVVVAFGLGWCVCLLRNSIRPHGELHIIEEEDRILYSLDVLGDLDDMANRKNIVLRVRK